MAVGFARAHAGRCCSPLSLSLSLWLALALVCTACDAGGFECPCCPENGSAVTLNLVDEGGAAYAGDWSVEATFDGVIVDTSACTQAADNGAATCGFGNDTGIYEIVVRTPLEEKALKARFSSHAGQNCCQSCIASERVTVVLVAP